MKLIKKIATIMFAFMMVVSMSCNVKADDITTPATGDGTIKINNAIPGQTYKLYRLLDLESYSVNEDGQKENGNYSYKPTSKWKTFLEGNGIRDVYFTFENGYASWKKGANVETFAKLAIEHANKENAVIEAEKTEVASAAIEGNNTPTVTFKNLPLGYYLVDSSVGTLCSLGTTNTDATIREKNGVPSVDKKVSSTETGNYDISNTASIGDTVYFKTTITAQPGAKNYVLHDKMTDGLTFNNKVEVKKGESPVATSDYTLKTSDFTDDCTFEIVFGQTFCDDLQKDEKITVTYSATLNENAVIGNVDKNTNETWLKYGDSQSTQPKTTTTKTFGIPVFKYTNVNTPLAGAEFILSTDPNCVDDTKNLKFTKNTEGKYRYDKTGSTTLTSLDKGRDKGRIDVEGLKAGTYYLKETKAPDGYNLLKKPVTITIDSEGKIYVDGSGEVNNGDVRVQNNSGTLLPNTGGVGTTMIYLIGGVLVLGSGVVLVTKRRVKNK